jgi:hypothetical protein
VSNTYKQNGKEKTMKNGLITSTILLMGMAITPAHATTAIFNWVTATNANTTLGLMDSLTNGGITLTAYALTVPSNLAKPAAAGPDLYSKSEGAGETGLGLINDPGGDNEISSQINDGIQIDFSNALAKDPKAIVTMSIGSVQAGEGWALYGSNTLLTVEGASKTDGTLGEPLVRGVGPYSNSTATVTLPDWGQYTYYTLLATSTTDCTNGDILLGIVTINGTSTPTATPEPGTMLMAGGTLIGLGMLMKKRQKKA